MFGWLFETIDGVRDRVRRARWTRDRAQGRRGEDIAHRHLRRLGYTIVARNWRTRSGSSEVDLVAWDGPALVFVEVKSRATDQYGAPDRAIGREKQIHIARAARDYARRAGIDWSQVRFDIVNVLYGKPPAVTHLRDAFRPPTEGS
ncbi:MAG: YraN family protein [Bryobacterales bacterium]|nr:YraN family protein [Bryobacterales bacterium]